MNQTEATMKRYVGMQILLMESSGKHEGKDAGGL